MTLTFGFFNSLNGDRKYNAEQLATLFDGIINDGVFASIGTSLVVEANTGMGVKVGLGRAWFNHTWVNNDAALPLTVADSEVVLNRIDAVVVEINTADNVRANTIKIIKGVPNTVPVNPTMVETETMHQHPLCYIYVTGGVTSINQANITNLVGTSVCPFITGMLQTMTIETISLLLEAEFDQWFTGVRTILDGDVGGNLLNLINEAVIISPVAPALPKSHMVWGEVNGLF